jgi:rubrerythrin
MALMFNADEIFEMAEQIEQNGAKYYRKAAAGAGDLRVRQLLVGLAAMEDRHEKVFADLRKHLTEQQKQPITFDPDDQAGAYLRALADGCVFDVSADPSERLTGKETAEEIYRTAIGLEKDSIVFYLGVLDMVNERLDKDRIDDIIKEEMRHVATLSNELRDLQSRRDRKA